MSCRCGSRDGDTAGVEGLSLDVLYTPGHTDDSYSFHFGDRVFTGDTLLIRGTGRTDFQNGDARAQYESLQRLMRLPDETLVFPAHDYKGDTVSTIGEEKRFNPRLQVRDADEYARLMEGLDLPNPKMMDVAVPANMQQGLHQAEVARRAGPCRRGGEGACRSPRRRAGRPARTAGTRAERRDSRLAPRPLRRFRTISARAAYSRAPPAARRCVLLRLRRALRHGGAGGADSGLASARHIEGGMSAWTKAGGATH